MLLESHPGAPSHRGLPEGGSLTSALPSLGGVKTSSLSSASTRTGSGPSGAAATSCGPTAGGYNYFVLVRQGKQVTAFPADMVYQFKPIIK